MQNQTVGVSLIVPSINCGNCANKIKAAIGALPGIVSVSASPARKETVIEFDAGQLSMERIEATMASIGHPVGPVPAGAGRTTCGGR